jgi:hypothetical protein
MAGEALGFSTVSIKGGGNFVSVQNGSKRRPKWNEVPSNLDLSVFRRM